MRLPKQAFPVMRMTGKAGVYRGVAPSSNCDVCTNILAGVIYVEAFVSCWAGCKGLGIAVGIACEAAFLGPEDPVGDIVCPIAGTAAGLICNQVGCGSLKNWTGATSAARQICTTAGIC